MGRYLIPELLRRGHDVRALVRPGSERKLPAGCTAVLGNALKKDSYAQQIAPAETFVQLVGVAHPNPSKAAEFRAVDLQSARDAVSAAQDAGVRHFIYVSVAQPAPVMKAYVAVRAECEEIIRASGLSSTIVRPWYVLGPGRWWPLVLLPMYWIAERIPATRDGARRLGLVTIGQMVAALATAVDSPPDGVRIVDVPAIRAARYFAR
ncbi:MAG: NAD(P)H-binding protein [Acidobacteria bacterium]|nr:NAD(P)H-binding protein [Acidobacteriota bacterium]MBI3663198.1 NAD(P)H-binding protein [Acidobacteriota bacterium]